MLVSFFPLLAALFYATYIGKRVTSAEELDVEAISNAYNENDLPSGTASIFPIILPIVLMASGSVAAFMDQGTPLKSVVVFLGKPVIALAAGLLSALPLLMRSKKMKELYDITQESLKVSGPIIFITAAGSVLGQVIVEAGFVGYIQQNAGALQSLGLFFPFIVAAILKSAQGSSTVALTTTAGLMGLYTSSSSLMYVLGLTSPVDASLAAMAIGAGAMTVSHANDSYFWVVTNFGKLTPQDGYRTQTAVTGIMGITAMAFIWVLSLIF